MTSTYLIKNNDGEIKKNSVSGYEKGGLKK